jgi:hypothetical protein
MTFDGSVSAVSNEPARRSRIGETFHWHPLNDAVAFGLKADTVADAEFRHLGLHVFAAGYEAARQPRGLGR